jgi:sodium/proline symporter
MKEAPKPAHALPTKLSIVSFGDQAIAIATIATTNTDNLPTNTNSGFGASFSPLVLFSLYWKKLTRAGAISGMVAGALVVIIWIAWIKDVESINSLHM